MIEYSHWARSRPFSHWWNPISAFQKSGCASGAIERQLTDGFHTSTWDTAYLPLEGSFTCGSGEFEHAVSIDVSTCSSHGFLDSTLDEYKASPIVPTVVMGCTGCTVPINLRATLRCTVALGITPAGHSPSSPPEGTYQSVEELLSLLLRR